MNIDQLASELRKQVAGTGKLVLDTRLLEADEVASIGTAFGLDGGAALSVEGLRPSGVSGPEQGVVSVSGGRSALLGVTEVSVQLSFNISQGWWR